MVVAAAKACGNEWEIEAGPTSSFFLGEQCLARRRHKEKAGGLKKKKETTSLRVCISKFFFFFPFGK